jgi:hypothetical protein
MLLGFVETRLDPQLTARPLIFLKSSLTLWPILRV